MILFSEAINLVRRMMQDLLLLMETKCNTVPATWNTEWVALIKYTKAEAFAVLKERREPGSLIMKCQQPCRSELHHQPKHATRVSREAARVSTLQQQTIRSSRYEQFDCTDRQTAPNFMGSVNAIIYSNECPAARPFTTQLLKHPQTHTIKRSSRPSIPCTAVICRSIFFISIRSRVLLCHSYNPQQDSPIYIIEPVLRSRSSVMGQWFGRRALVLTLFMALMAMAAGRESSIAFTSSFQTETYTPTTEPPPYDSPPTYSPPSDSAPTTPSPDYNSPPSGSYSPTTPSSGSDSPPSSPSSPGPSGEYSNPTAPSPEYYSLAPESGSSPTAPDASGYSPPSPIVADVPAPSIDVPSTPTYSSPAVDPFNCPPLGGSGHGSWWRGTADSASTLTYGGDPDDVSPIIGPQEPAPVAYTPPVGGDPSTAPYTPDPAVPDTPVAPTDGTCTFWSSNTHKFPDFLTILTPILDIFGGNTGSIFGSQMTLFQGLTNSRPDAFGSLLRQGSAAVLNSYTNRNFAYTPFQVKSSFRGALVSQQAAAVQAVNFENANRGYMRRH